LNKNDSVGSNITVKKVRHKERPLQGIKKFLKFQMPLTIMGTTFGNGQFKTLFEETRQYYIEIS
jgi:hypothetical protein